MRDSRRQNGFPAWAGLAALLVLALAAISPARAGATPAPTAVPAATSTATPTPSATPTPTTTPTPTATPTSTPTATPAPTSTPTPQPVVGCQNPWATAYPHDHIVRGEAVRVAFHDFEPDGGVTLLFVAQATTAIGTGNADAQGEGVVEGVIPADTPIGEAEMRVVGAHCIAYTSLLVIGSAEAMTVDDETPVPGQVVTISAGGFAIESPIEISIDRYPIQGECYPRACRFIGTGSADTLGHVVMHVRIPSDVKPGTHHLYATGYSPDGISDFTVGVAIHVAGATGTLPPTDTAS